MFTISVKKSSSSHPKEKKSLLHPVFFFNGYLYKRNVKELSETIKTINLKPISHYNEITNLLSKKLIAVFQTLN